MPEWFVASPPAEPRQALAEPPWPDIWRLLEERSEHFAPLATPPTEITFPITTTPAARIVLLPFF